MGAAAQAVARNMRDSLILTIQNGLGAGERIAKFFDKYFVLLGVAEGFGASMKGPGHAHHNAMRQIRIGEMNGGLTERLQTLESVWKEAGFNANGFADIHQLIWEKYICNVFLSAPCAVFVCTMGELVCIADCQNIALGCFEEAYQAEKQKGSIFPLRMQMTMRSNLRLLCQMPVHPCVWIM